MLLAPNRGRRATTGTAFSALHSLSRGRKRRLCQRRHNSSELRQTHELQFGAYIETLEDRTLLSNVGLVDAGLLDALGTLDQGVKGENVLGTRIPFVGGNLKDTEAAKFVANLQAEIDDQLDGMETMSGEVSAGIEAALMALGLDGQVNVQTENAGMPDEVVKVRRRGLTDIRSRTSLIRHWL